MVARVVVAVFARCALVIGSKVLCHKPISVGAMHVPCGQCMACRLNRKRVWTHRIMLEASLREDNSFITLTYSEEKLKFTTPGSVDGQSMTSGFPTLAPKDLQNWLKRFRKEISPLKIRFFAVGEYGDLSFRPHYHVALFGYPTCAYGRSRYGSHKKNCCPQCDLIRDTWGNGQIDVGSLTPESAQYIAGYVTKKMTGKDDERLYGRHPEFSRMSRRPGIGVDFMHEVASTLLEFNLDETQSDVPVTLRHGKRELPLGRTLRRKLRGLIGKDEGAPQSAIDEYQEKMREVRETARNDPKNPSVVSHIEKRYKQARLNQEAKAKLFKKRGSI